MKHYFCISRNVFLESMCYLWSSDLYKITRLKHFCKYKYHVLGHEETEFCHKMSNTFCMFLTINTHCFPKMN